MVKFDDCKLAELPLQVNFLSKWVCSRDLKQETLHG